MLIIGDSLDNTIKQIFRNTFIYIKNNNLEFSIESYFEIFCSQAKLLNINFDECSWFNTWINRFDDKIKKELNNYPIKNRDDFINILSKIINTKLIDSSLRFEESSTKNILDKALILLKQNNILDIDVNLSLKNIDLELTKLIDKNNNFDFFAVKPPMLLDKPEFYEILKNSNKEDCILIFDICYFDIIKKNLEKDSAVKLFNAFYKILIDNCVEDCIIGIYSKNSISIIPPKFNLEESEIYANKIQDAINKSIFMYKNQKINIKINIQIMKIKDLHL